MWIAAGDRIKQAAECTMRVTGRVVDAVEDKTIDVTDILQDALYRNGQNIHKAAGCSDAPEKKLLRGRWLGM